MLLKRTVQSPRSAEAAFAYLADFTTTTEWDPGTVKTERISGDGGVGTTYRNTSRFNGRETELTYTVIEYVPNQKIVLRGMNKTVTAIDTISVVPTESGCEVTYSADFEFKGLARFAEPFLKSAFDKLGNEAEAGLRKALA